MGPDWLYCGKWRKISKLRHDLDIGRIMPNVELFSYTTIYLNFMFLDQFLFELSCKNTHTHGNTQDAHKGSDEYSIVAFCDYERDMKCTSKLICVEPMQYLLSLYNRRTWTSTEMKVKKFIINIQYTLFFSTKK